MDSTNINLHNIKNKSNSKQILNNLKVKILLKLIKYNKSLENEIGININNYKDYSKIIIEIIPIKNIDGYFININEDYKPYYHIYFDYKYKKEIKRNYIKKEEKITFINIILDNEIKSLSHLFEGCQCIEKINFTQ